MAATAVQNSSSAGVQPPRSMAQSIGKGTVAGIFANLVRFGTRLVLVPILISHLGLGGYGIWATVLVIAGYLRFGSAGVKTCFQKYVAEAYAKGDYERANQLLTTGTAIFVAMSAALLIPAAIFPRFLAHLAGIPLEYASSSAAAIVLLAIGYMISNAMAAFESAVLGAHRVHLMQGVSVSTMIFEAVWFILALHLGFGLAALALGMAISEAGYAISGLIIAKRVIPQISLRKKYLNRGVLGELVRFTGSYQLLNIMEVLYFSVVPIVLLREFGPVTAGVFALSDRLTRFATMGLEASLVPLLSGSTTVFNAGSSVRMSAFLSKAFKLSLVATLLPLAFVSAFGSSAMFAWTAQTNDLFRFGILLVALTALFRSIAKVGMVLYRSTGGASMDSGAQLIRIAILVLVVILGKRWGYYGAVSGLVAAELAGMIFMLTALFRRVGCFSMGRLFGETAHLSVSVVALVAIGKLIMRIPIPFHGGTRMLALMQFGMMTAVTLALVWPAFVATRYLSQDERSQILDTIMPWRRAAAARSISHD